MGFRQQDDALPGSSQEVNIHGASSDNNFFGTKEARRRFSQKTMIEALEVFDLRLVCLTWRQYNMAWKFPLLLSRAWGGSFSSKRITKGVMMKKFAVQMMIALVVCALAGNAALAKVKSRTITVGVDFVVGNTLVKKGTYKWSFDTSTNELTVTAKDKTVVAKTIAHLEERKTTSFGTDVVLAQKGSNQMLISIAFAGESQNIVVQSDGVETAKGQ
jgi:hypothetical protein